MEHIQLRITDIIQETPNCKSYVVERTDGSEIKYKAGQFFTLIIKINGKEVRRSYSISSTPGVDSIVCFTVKRIENGEVSRHLYDYLEIGDLIYSLPPTGRFTIEKPQEEVAVFIAAGSGITPVYSLIRRLLLCFDKIQVVLIYQNHNESESIFRDELRILHQNHRDRFKYVELFSQPNAHKQISQRLNNYLLEKILLEAVGSQNVSFYLCGPESFMRLCRFTLKVMGYGNETIRSENFFASAPPPPVVTDRTPHWVTIQLAGETHHIEVVFPQTILDAALKNQIDLPYSCKGGRCSTCTALCTRGKVKMSINDVLTHADLERGLILTCVSYPETDVELTYDVEWE